MNWKLCIAVLLSSSLILVPQNIIGCGPSDDPYDYYTSFFSQQLQNDPGFRPFYYTGYRFLYDENEPVSTKEATSAEWNIYTNKLVNINDAQEFVLKYSYKQLSVIYNHIEKKQALTVADSVKRNSFTKWFIQSKDLEALGYLLFAKQTEPFVTGDEDYWAELNRDSVKMQRLIKSGTQLWSAAKNDFIKLRYGYQITRLAHYAEQYDNCIAYYNLYVQPNNTASVLQSLSLGLKAGALYHTGKREEAAYYFAQLCAANVLKRRSNYTSFSFSTMKDEDGSRITKNDVLKFCRNNKEKANLTAAYAVNSTANNLPELKEIYQLDPSSPMLELLTIREINKLEEKYLHPSIQKAKGEKIMYAWALFGWDAENPNYDSLYNESENEAKQMISFCHTVAQNNLVQNKGLFEVAAAYAAYISKNLKLANTYLQSAKQMQLSEKVNDQWMLTNLLVRINEKEKIDAAFEAEILPSVQWLEKKAKKDDEWRKFYRNLFSEIIALHYKKHNNNHKAALALGCADKIMQVDENEDYAYWRYSSLNYLRTNLTATEIEALHKLMSATAKTGWETFLVNHNSYTNNEVADIAGTAYLREHDWVNAERWLKQVSSSYYKQEPYKTFLVANPFANLLYDTHAPTKQDTVVYNKLQYVRKMNTLLQQTTTGTNGQKANAFYQLANGLYQSSYWGNSWLLQEYGWSGNDGLTGLTEKEYWKKEYYGVFTAEAYYLKAKELSTDKNFQARCLFMAAKCAQKQLPVPLYASFANYDLYEKAGEQYAQDIKHNKHFAELVTNYGQTKAYTEVFNSCVYLQDYVKKK
jgi:hypothetical protein